MTIKAKNNKFSGLTEAQKRVAIAKDVLAQIRSRKFKIQQGAWAVWDYARNLNQDTLTGNTGEKPLRCTACALGAAMLSSIRLFNDCEIGGACGEYEVDNQLGKWFSDRQRALIEYTFEKGKGMKNPWDDEDELRARLFYKKYPSAIKRAVAIFKNIVKNKGDFKP